MCQKSQNRIRSANPETIGTVSYDVMMAFSAVIKSWSGRKALFPANAGIVEL